jgi:hypothetical protein
MKFKSRIIPLIFFIYLAFGIFSCNSPISFFSTGGHTVYQLKPGTVDNSNIRVIISASYGGVIQCHYSNGKLLWEKQTDGFPFDLEVVDIDGDNLDETMIASSDGVLYTLDHNGKLLWTFSKEPPLYQVCVCRVKDEPVIFTGGVEEKIYSISSKGKVLDTFKTTGAVRLMEAGDIFGEGKDYLAVGSTDHTNKGICSVYLLDPNNLEVIWEESDPERVWAPLQKIGRSYCMNVWDIDKDGKEDIILTMHKWNSPGKFIVYNYKGEESYWESQCSENIPIRNWAMPTISHINSSSLNEEYILELFGDQIITFDLDGRCRSILDGPYSFANGSFDPQTNTYYLGSAISGGDCIHLLHLDKVGWKNAYKNLKASGDLARIEQNIAKLNVQIANYKLPEYQVKTQKSLVMLGPVPVDNKKFYTGEIFDNLTIARYTNRRFLEDYKVPEFIFYSQESRKSWEEKVNARKRMSSFPKSSILKWEVLTTPEEGAIGLATRREIINFAREMETTGQTFALWAGHGNHFWITPKTCMEILKAAPKTFKAFCFFEPHHGGKSIEDVIQKQLIPLADSCLKYEKNILLAGKKLFWNGNYNLEPWKSLLMNEKYSGVIVPAMEETNLRSQELFLMGYVGLWLGGYFDHFTGKVDTDNASFIRTHEWGNLQLQSHHLRSLIYRASLGADIFHVGIFNGDVNDLIEPFFKMLDKGIIYIPQREDILSLSDVCLGIKIPSPSYLRHGGNTHNFSYQEDSKSFVFDRLDCYWGAAPIQPHDFSSYGTGCRFRMHNFLPMNPYGLIAMVPDEIDITEFPYFNLKITTDGEYFYDGEGNKRSPQEYKLVVKKHLLESSKKLPILVKGDVAWTASRIDSTHIRITLIDPGYLNPSPRKVKIILQNIDGEECMDILSGEKIRINNNEINISVPIGTIRIVDIKHLKKD